MEFIHDIINNPNFGRLFHGSNEFRSVFNRLLSFTPESDEVTQALHQKLEIDMENERLVLKSRDLNFSWTAEQGETPSDFFMRIITGQAGTTTPPGLQLPDFDPIGDIGFGYVKSSEIIRGGVARTPLGILKDRNFRMGRREVEAIAEKRGLTIRYRTIGAPKGTTLRQALEAVEANMGKDPDTGEYYGLLRSDDDIIREVVAWDRQDKRLTSSEIYEAIGVKPEEVHLTGTVNKRLNAIFNAPAFQMQMPSGPGEFTSATFDPRTFYSQDPLLKTRAEALAKLEFDRPTAAGKTLEEIENNIYSSYSDGLIMMDDKRFITHVNRMKEEFRTQNLQRLEAELKNGVITDAQYKRHLKEIDKVYRDTGELAKKARAGLKMNARVIGSQDVFTGIVGDAYSKGDLLLISKADKRAMLRRMDPKFRDMSREELDAIDIITDTGNRKKELGQMTDVPPFMTLDAVAKIDEQSWTNTIAIASHREMYNPPLPEGGSFLMESFRREWAGTMDAISRGDLGGLHKLIEDIEKININDYDNFAERQAVLDNQRYARRIQEFVRSGNRVDLNETMIHDLYRIARSHFFRERKFGQDIRVGGKDVTDYALRLPQFRSTRAHMTTEVDFRTVGGYITDRLGMNIDPNFNAKGAFGLTGSDVKLMRAAMGGMDLDDAISINNYTYDPETKRLLAFITRDPTDLGEYMFMDAQFGLDRHFQKATTMNGESVRKIFTERKDILRQLESLGRRNNWEDKFSTKDQDEIRRLVRRLNEINEGLDQFLAGDEMIPKEDMASRYGIRNEFNREYAPMGFRTTEESLARYREQSILRSYGQIEYEGAPSFMARLRAALALEEEAIPSLPFEFVGEDFTELLTGPGGVGESDLFVSYRELPEFQDKIREFNQRTARFDDIQKRTRAIIDSGTATSEEIAEARRLLSATQETIARGVADAQGLLGRIVNAATLINQAVVGNDAVGMAGRSAEDIARWREIMRGEGRIAYMTREQMIDPITKTGDKEYLELIENVLNRNLRTIGKAMGQPGANHGFDPITLAQRGGLDYDQIKKILSGYRETLVDGENYSDDELIEQLTLGREDDRAWVSKLDKEYREARESSLLQEFTAREAANQKMLEQLSDVDPTPLQRSRAEEILDAYYKERQALNAVRDDPDALRAVLGEAMDTDPDLVGDINQILSQANENDLNTNMLRRYHKWGLFNDRSALYEQILATLKVSLEAQQKVGEATRTMPVATEPLMLTTTRVRETSIGELTGEAVRANQERLLRGSIDRAAREYDAAIDPIDTYFDNVINKLVKEHGKVADPQALMNAQYLAVQRMRGAGGEGYQRTIRRLAQGLGIGYGKREAPEVTLRRVGEVPEPRVPRYKRPRPVEIPDVIPGSKRHAARTVSDETTSQILKTNMLRRFTGSEFARLLSTPGFRKGLGAAAIFAGLGLMHEMRGDRTPEQMQGPPLLPGGSAYEDMPQQQLPRPIAMPQRGTGYTYQVRASGRFNPNSLSNELQGITGSNVNSTIYNTRETYNPAAHSTSVDVLNMLMEG